MTTTTTSPPSRAAAWVGGGLALFGALVALCGVVLLGVFGSDGTLSTGRHAVSTDTAALVTESAQIDDISSGTDFLGRVSVHVHTDPGVFVGVGRAADVE